MPVIFLTGFMGSGKTSVGRRLAERLGRVFVDLDERVYARSGASIREIFACAGERAFRVLEGDVLRETALAGQEAVVATGGGTPVDPANRAVMKACGTIVYLEAEFATLKGRIPDDPERPLWGESAQELLQSRLASYRDADIVIATDNLTVAEVVDAVAGRLHGLPRQVPVLAPSSPYPVYTGQGVLRRARRLISRHLRPEGLFVVADERVMDLHGDLVRASLTTTPGAFMTIPQGESSKSLGVLGQVLETMAQARVNRQWACAAVGGGVTGDIAAFASSVYMRGIPVIQVPTTLLAQVDSSVGGKTGIDLPSGKNLAGTFHQPLLVISDTVFLTTLGHDLLRDAMSEVVKYAIVMDAPLFAYLEQASDPDYARIVPMCVSDKAHIVSQDEREGGLRRILNFGHTLGHAIEHATGYAASHGRAVAAGMYFSIWLSRRLDLIDEKTCARMSRLVERWTYPREELPWPEPAEIGHALEVDKKSTHDGIQFVLTQGVGDGTVKKLSGSQILGAYGRFVGKDPEGLR